MTAVDINTGPRTEATTGAPKIEAPKINVETPAQSFLNSFDAAKKSPSLGDLANWKENSPGGILVPPRSEGPTTGTKPETGPANAFTKLDTSTFTPSLDTATDPTLAKASGVIQEVTATQTAASGTPTAETTAQVLQPGELTNTLNDMDRVVPPSEASGNNPDQQQTAQGLRPGELTDTLNEMDRVVIPQNENRSGEKVAQPETPEQKSKRELGELDAKWRDTAARGEDPTEGMIAWMNKNAEMQGLTLPEGEAQRFRDLMQEVYKDGAITTPEGKFSSDIREKFIEMGRLDAEIVALKGLIARLKEGEKKLKAEQVEAEEAYLKEQNPTERQVKYREYELKTGNLQGYQMAINDSAGRGREANIERRRIAGWIHRKLGSRNLIGNLLFGARTAIYEMSDEFQDRTIDKVRNQFGFA